MTIYDIRPDLQALFPEAANAVDLSGLICWADSHIKTEGENANPILLPHAAFYDSQCI